VQPQQLLRLHAFLKPTACYLCAGANIAGSGFGVL
jgi:hypothetical protein